MNMIELIRLNRNFIWIVILLVPFQSCTNTYMSHVLDTPTPTEKGDIEIIAAGGLNNVSGTVGYAVSDKLSIHGSIAGIQHTLRFGFGGSVHLLNENNIGWSFTAGYNNTHVWDVLRVTDTFVPNSGLESIDVYYHQPYFQLSWQQNNHGNIIMVGIPLSIVIVDRWNYSMLIDNVTEDFSQTGIATIVGISVTFKVGPNDIPGLGYISFGLEHSFKKGFHLNLNEGSGSGNIRIGITLNSNLLKQGGDGSESSNMLY